MKLRVRNNSIRLRLTQRDVAVFAEQGAVEETIEFGLTADKRLIYRLEQNTVAGDVKADFANGKITITVPANQAKIWVETDQIGINGEQILGAGKTLRVLIEKDFACPQPRDGEGESDAFLQPENAKIC